MLLATLLLPDLSMLGYLAGPRIGAVCYNMAHHKALAIAVGVSGWWLGSSLLLLAGTVLLLHSAFDRLLGYWLKYATGFHDTNLGPVGARLTGATDQLSTAIYIRQRVRVVLGLFRNELQALSLRPTSRP